MITDKPALQSTTGKLVNNIRRRSKTLWGSNELELPNVSNMGNHHALDRTSHASIQELPEDALDDTHFDK